MAFFFKTPDKKRAQLMSVPFFAVQTLTIPE